MARILKQQISNKLKKEGGERMSETTYGKDGSKHVSDDKGNYVETWHYNNQGDATGVTDTDKDSGNSHTHNVGWGLLGPFKGSRR